MNALGTAAGSLVAALALGVVGLVVWTLKTAKVAGGTSLQCFLMSSDHEPANITLSV